MNAPSPGFFSSDAAFTKGLGTTLACIGGLFLLLGLSCSLIPWAYCGVEVVPILTGLEGIDVSFTDVTLPLFLLMIGISLRLYTRLGWVITLLLQVMLSLVLSMLLYYDAIAMRFASPDALFYPLQCAITNGCLLLLCLFGMVYLLLRPVRSLYGMDFEQ